MPQIVAPPENKTIETRPIITTCPHCKCTVSYTENEVERVTNDGEGFMCPNCDEPVVVKRIEPFIFPDTFTRVTSLDGSTLSNEEVQRYVNKVKHQLQTDLQVGEYTYCGTKDTMVFGFKFEDEDQIIVAKNYWEDSVFRE